MEAILLGIYSFFVWLIFIKKKWLPWTTPWKVTVVIIPVVGLACMILLLNVFAPSSADVRVYKYTIPIVSQVRGRVIEVPVEEGNRLVKKGEVLFKVDPTPYQLDVNTLTAQLATAQASNREIEESLKGARGKVAETRGVITQTASRTREVSAKLELARKRVAQYRELQASGAGSRFEVERAETDLKELEGQLDAVRSTEAQAKAAEAQALASEQQVMQKLGAKANGEFAQVAQIRAQLENAKWLLAETTTVSPCDCYVVNLQLRKGFFVAGLPLNPVMTLVEAEGQVIAFYSQNELHQVAPGNEVEFTLNTQPGKVVKGSVDSVIWAQGAGQLQASGSIPMAGMLAQPPGRYAVKFNIAEKDRAMFMAAGAAGAAAIYTDHLHMLHIIRKVMLRVGSYVNYLVLKLH
ncbi:HlyD family secretion protein [Usitatibacter palustris]|uniref:Inner membrane protein YiaV n=1 Tax=Usitatibacter palustris TaxID=2732487 RepID=A0A6M4H6L3_9PROT|nr:biotin/lipoyl-binding protein [Usitatibacter palustris]QJR15256.1 Inner membrane protein YiaV [Usitatibacter palustris]